MAFATWTSSHSTSHPGKGLILGGPWLEDIRIFTFTATKVGFPATFLIPGPGPSPMSQQHTMTHQHVFGKSGSLYLALIVKGHRLCRAVISNHFESSSEWCMRKRTETKEKRTKPLQNPHAEKWSLGVRKLMVFFSVVVRVASENPQARGNAFFAKCHFNNGIPYRCSRTFWGSIGGWFRGLSTVASQVVYPLAIWHNCGKSPV